MEKPPVKVDYSEFPVYPEVLKSKLLQVSGRWLTKAEPVFKIFTCDNCERKMHKAYHVWDVQKEIMIEAHFCRICGRKLGLGK